MKYKFIRREIGIHMKDLNSKLMKLFILIFLSIFILFSNSIIDVQATTDRYAWNYDDEFAEQRWWINDNSGPEGFENLRIEYNMNDGICIARGIRYKYLSNGPGPIHDMDLEFEGDSYTVYSDDTNIPYAAVDSWRTLRLAGPVYLLDDDPAINFIGTDPSDNCIALCADSPSRGHSFYDVGSGWTQDLEGEYIAQVLYERVKTLNISDAETGSFTSSDNVDAYFLNLNSGNTYEFFLERLSGSGNFNMKLFTDKEVTDVLLTQSSGTTYPKYLSYSPSSSGTYVLLVEVVNAGLDTAEYSIEYSIDSPPIADFIANETTITEGQSVQFTFTGNEGNPPATFLWDFGDLTPTSTDQNPIHQYTTPGTYTITLTVQDNDSDIDIEIKIDYINVEADIFPSSDFIGNETNIFQGEYVQFNFTGTQGNAPATYLWDFGDGSPTSDLQNPLHQYFAVGVFNVSLNVTDRNSDEDSLVKYDYITVNLNEIPIANFTANETIIKEGDWIQFNFTGTEGTIPATYQWDFGDGTANSSIQDPIHQYISAGIYTVTLTIEDNDNDIDIETKIDYITVEEELVNGTLSSLIIDDSGGGDYTWAEAVIENWCSGSGILSDPYILEYLNINSQNSGSCILIEHSDKYFIIAYCILYNSGINTYDAGIKLNNVSNGILRYNNCSFNNGNGIVLNNCQNITISENSMNNNTISGISLINSEYNDIIDNLNTIDYNGQYGVYLLMSNYNNIDDNQINNNPIGVYLYESNYNSIIDNFLVGNSDPVLEVGNCIGNIIEGNSIPNGGTNPPFPWEIILFIGFAVMIISAIGIVILWKKRSSQQAISPEISSEEQLEITPSIIPEQDGGQLEVKQEEPLREESPIPIDILQSSIMNRSLIPTIEEEVRTEDEENLTPLVDNEIIRGHNVFMSYSTLDAKHFRIVDIVKYLKKYPNINEVLFWEADSKQNIVEFMEESLTKTEVFVLFCSENSSKSKAVKDEWQAAFQLKKKDKMKIIPVYEDEDQIPNLLMPLLNVKYTKETFDDFIKKLSHEINR